MSLIHKQEMTEQNLAAKRANGKTTQGPVTPEGKANSAAANLRHGLYCQAPSRVLTALGEDPQDYAELMDSLETNLVEGLERQLVQCIGDTLWRMERAVRVQNSVALKRLRAAKDRHDSTALPQQLQAHENLECYEDLGAALKRRGNGPDAAEIRRFKKMVGDDPSEEMQEFLVLLKSLNELPNGPERKAARRQARKQLSALEENYRRICVRIAKELEEMQSPEQLAAVIAPQDDKSLFMQKAEDSNLRQLWRLTNVLFKIRNGALHHKDVKNEDRPDYVHENTGDGDKMSSENAVILQENTPTAA